MSESTTLFPREASIGASAAVPAKPARSLRLPLRPIKLGIGFSLLMAGFYGIVSDRQYLSTDSAVVTAYLTEVRSPIDGVLSGMPAAAGGPVARGALLGAVDNRLFDQQHLVSLSIIEQQARSGADAAGSERAALEAQERELIERAAIHQQAVSGRLRGEQAEAERLLAARVADLDQARRELDRGKQLHDAGILADSEYEKLQSNSAVATANEAAQRAAVTTVEIELRAADAGVLSEPGMNNDVPYSRQRADEVRLRLAEVERSQSALAAQADDAHVDVDAETERMGLMRHAELISPISGMLWKLEAVNGERIATGDAVARVVACDQSFVLAEVPQERVPEIAIGAKTLLRLTGESQERAGRVLGISGDPQLDSDRKVAAFPTQNPRQHLATVRISLEGAASGECAVGRSARVLIAVGDGGLVARAWRRYF